MRDKPWPGGSLLSSYLADRRYPCVAAAPTVTPRGRGRAAFCDFWKFLSDFLSFVSDFQTEIVLNTDRGPSQHPGSQRRGMKLIGKSLK